MMTTNVAICEGSLKKLLLSQVDESDGHEINGFSNKTMEFELLDRKLVLPQQSRIPKQKSTKKRLPTPKNRKPEEKRYRRRP
jgi:hypothetical protein